MFGMGTGGSLRLLSPEILRYRAFKTTQDRIDLSGTRFVSSSFRFTLVLALLQLALSFLLPFSHSG